jgi:hypothetical protein
MGISDEIRDSIKDRVVLRSTGDNSADTNRCVICGNYFQTRGTLTLYTREEGHVCLSCGERFAPEMVMNMKKFDHKNIRSCIKKQEPTAAKSLSSEEWAEVDKNIDCLLKITNYLAKGISRGIIEAPAGHIGLLHFAKNITKPSRKPNESDKDYDLRVKSFRMAALYERIKNETWNPINTLKSYFVKLGLPLKFPSTPE